MSREQAIAESASSKDALERIWESFRRWGYLQANLDPLGDIEPAPMPELDVSGPEAEAARRVYCGSIGAEFMHIPDRERRMWVQERMESEVAEPDRARILDLLIRADIFEQVLQTRYLGTKRYSLEGEVGADSAARFDPERRRRAGRRKSHAGDEPSRTAQRDGAHRRARGCRRVRAI